MLGVHEQFDIQAEKNVGESVESRKYAVAVMTVFRCESIRRPSRKQPRAASYNALKRRLRRFERFRLTRSFFVSVKTVGAEASIDRHVGRKVQKSARGPA